jgi:hypothetical protein
VDLHFKKQSSAGRTEASGGGDVSHLSGASGGGAVSRHSRGKRSHHVTSQREGPVHHL